MGSTETTIATATEIRPFHVDVPEEELVDLRRRIDGDALAEQGDWSTTGTQGVQLAALQALARYWLERVRLRAARGAAERAAAVRHRDRRRGHPLHPRQVRARERAAADHDARLARLGGRAARLGRPADRPDGARRQRRGRLPPRAALPARVRALRRAGRDRLGPGAHRTGLGRADAPSRLHALRGPGRRRGRRRHRHDGPPGARGAVGIHTNLLVPALGGAMPTDTDEERAAAAADRHLRDSHGATATSSRWPPGRRRSATPCSTRRSPWPPG